MEFPRWTWTGESRGRSSLHSWLAQRGDSLPLRAGAGRIRLDDAGSMDPRKSLSHLTSVRVLRADEEHSGHAIAPSPPNVAPIASCHVEDIFDPSTRQLITSIVGGSVPQSEARNGPGNSPAIRGTKSRLAESAGGREGARRGLQPASGGSEQRPALLL